VILNQPMRVGGVCVYWTTAELNDRSVLEDGLTVLGYPDLVPDPRTAPAALKDALEDVFRGQAFDVARLHKSNGFEVVRIDRRAFPVPNVRTVEMMCQVTEDDGKQVVEFDPLDDRHAKVMDRFRAQLGYVTRSAVTEALVAVVYRLGGTRLVEKGGLYWLPDHRLDDWRAVAGVVEKAGVNRRNSVQLVRTVFDADSVRAVRDAIVAEVRGEAQRIDREIEEGGLGDRAMESRRQQAQDLREKVKLYESLLGVGLESLHEVVDHAEIAACKATVLASAQELLATA
jgi:hypothetical protein